MEYLVPSSVALRQQSHFTEAASTVVEPIIQGRGHAEWMLISKVMLTR